MLLDVGGGTGKLILSYLSKKMISFIHPVPHYFSSICNFFCSVFPFLKNFLIFGTNY